jgi:hypothetical protein
MTPTVEYFGLALDPEPLDPGELSVWIPLAPNNQTERAAVLELLHEVEIEHAENGLPGDANHADLGLLFRDAVGGLDLTWAGDHDCLHWFKLTWHNNRA